VVSITTCQREVRCHLFYGDASQLATHQRESTRGGESISREADVRSFLAYTMVVSEDLPDMYRMSILVLAVYEIVKLEALSTLYKKA
jgi:hypothetical protein